MSRFTLIILSLLALSLSACADETREKTLEEETLESIRAATRDPFEQPFTSESIWNMPIGSEARYAKVDIEPAKNTAADVVHVLRMEESDPLRQVYVPNAWFDKGEPRCSGREKIDLKLRLPDDYIVPDIGNSPYGVTPNSTFAFILPDGKTVLGGSIARCKEGGAAYMPPHFRWPNNVEKAKGNLYGNGLDGRGHGATQLSSFGGLLREGELTNNAPIRHTLKMMLWGKKLLYYDAETEGYRWPAKSADKYAPSTYSGTKKPLRMGSLLAIPPEVERSDLGLETKAARKVFQALKDYGAYVTEDTNWDAQAITISEPAYLEFERVYGYTLEDNGTPWARDLDKLVSVLHVVDNNYPKRIGGGGTPRRPLLPPLK